MPANPAGSGCMKRRGYTLVLEVLKQCYQVQVWVLDALPGEVRTGGRETQDHPAALIAHLQQIPLPLPNRTALQNNLLDNGFSLTVARWASTNLRPLNGDHRYSSLIVEYLAADAWQDCRCSSINVYMFNLTYFQLRPLV